MTETEKRYSNIEGELLGVVFGLERLHHYTFGSPITVETDHQTPHKHLEEDYSKFKSKSAEDCYSGLAQYDVHIEYLRGRENVIADALSHVGPLAPESQDYMTSLNNVEKIPVHQITQIAPASSERLEELHEATAKDHQLQLLARAVH